MAKGSLFEACCRASTTKAAVAILILGLAGEAGGLDESCAQGDAQASSPSLLQLGHRGPPHRASLLADVLPRMQYWSRWKGVRPSAAESPASGLEEKFLLFDYDKGGLNNIRIGWEVAATLAYQTGRTLVLPPPAGFYLIDWGPSYGDYPNKSHKSKFEDFINMDNLREGGLRVVTFNEFVNAQQEDSDAISLYEGKKSHARIVHGPDTKMCDIALYRVKDKLVYAKFINYNDGRLFSCSKWWSLGQVKLKDEGVNWTPSRQALAIIHGGLVWHPDVFEMASCIVQDLGIFTYTSLHARYGDFQFASDLETASAIIDTWFLDDWGHRLTSDMTVYVSTDDTSGHVTRAFDKKGIRAKSSLDYWDKPDSPIAHLIQKWGEMRVAQLKGPVEQVICTFGRIFIGTGHSTFSGYIQQMRHNVDAPQTALLYHTEVPTEQTVTQVEAQVRSWEARDGADTWEPPRLDAAVMLQLQGGDEPAGGQAPKGPPME